MCRESELLELRQQRNVLKDRLEDAKASLRQLAARLEHLGEAEEMKQKLWRTEGELRELCLRAVEEVFVSISDDAKSFSLQFKEVLSLRGISKGFTERKEAFQGV